MPLPKEEEEEAATGSPFRAANVAGFGNPETVAKEATGAAVASMAKAVGPAPLGSLDDRHGESADGSSPVGRRLCEFARRWGELTQDGFVLDTISEGYCLEFTGRPPLQDTPCPLDLHRQRRRE